MEHFRVEMVKSYRLGEWQRRILFPKLRVSPTKQNVNINVNKLHTVPPDHIIENNVPEATNVSFLVKLNN